MYHFGKSLLLMDKNVCSTHFTEAEMFFEVNHLLENQWNLNVSAEKQYVEK